MLKIVKILFICGLSAFTCVVSWAALIYTKHRRYDHLPGPKRTSFWLGNYDLVLKLKRGNYTFSDLTRDLSREYGRTFCFWYLWFPFVTTIDQDATHTLLSGSERKSTSRYNALGWVLGHRFLGFGLATDTLPERWRIRSDHVRSMFRKTELSRVIHVFNEIGHELIEALKCKHQTDEDTFQILDLLHASSCNAITKVAFSTDISTLGEGNANFYKEINDILKALWDSSIRHPFMGLNPFSKLAYKRHAWKCVRHMRALGTKILNQRMKSLDAREEVPRDALALLLESHYELRHLRGSSALDVDLIVDDIVTILFAGQDSIANTVAFLLREVCSHPNVKQRLVSDIDRVVGNQGDITLGHLKQLPYLEWVWKETLRLFPPQGRTFRETANDYTFDGCYIPKGTVVGVDIFAAHRYPEYAINPDYFDPERFSGDNKAQPPKVFIPFSKGARACMGKHFAEIESQILVVKILQTFDLRWAENQVHEFVEDLTIRPSSSKFSVALRTAHV